MKNKGNLRHIGGVYRVAKVAKCGKLRRKPPAVLWVCATAIGTTKGQGNHCQADDGGNIQGGERPL